MFIDASEASHATKGFLFYEIRRIDLAEMTK